MSDSKNYSTDLSFFAIRELQKFNNIDGHIININILIVAYKKGWKTGSKGYKHMTCRPIIISGMEFGQQSVDQLRISRMFFMSLIVVQEIIFSY